MPKVPDGRLTSIWTVCTIYGLSDSSHRRIGMGGLVPPPPQITKLPMNEAQIASLFECPFTMYHRNVVWIPGFISQNV